jgi:hypothetical protein
MLCSDSQPKRGFCAGMMRSVVFTVILLFAVHAVAIAQNKLDPTADPISGRATLSAGFTPDPYKVRAKSGGTINVSELGLCTGCRGYASKAPDFKLHWSGGSGSLRIFFEADDRTKDATLVINTPNGTWIGNDDAFSGTNNPMLILSGYGEGRYDIWIGSYRSGEYIAGSLTITELELTPQGTSSTTATTASSSDGLCSSCDAITGTFRLAEDFTPDPFTIRLNSGGTINVSSQNLCSTCRGHATRSPDIKLMWTGSSSDLRIYFEADDNSKDATIIVNTPNGTWLGNDDAFSGTRNPMLQLSGYGEGRYDIWVGSYTSGEYISGTLTITELNRQPR